MEIIKAKTAGFCFGVDRAVKLTTELAQSGRKVATLGPLIHNPQCVAELEKLGVVTAGTLADVPEGYELVIRSHGVPQSVYDQIEAAGIVCHDATCPFVAKIHRIARKASDEGAVLLVAGDAAIRRCRASWATPTKRCSFSPIFPSWRAGKAPKPPKRPFLWWRRPRFR